MFTCWQHWQMTHLKTQFPWQTLVWINCRFSDKCWGMLECCWQQCCLKQNLTYLSARDRQTDTLKCIQNISRSATLQLQTEANGKWNVLNVPRDARPSLSGAYVVLLLHVHVCPLLPEHSAAATLPDCSPSGASRHRPVRTFISLPSCSQTVQHIRPCHLLRLLPACASNS